VLLKEQYRNPRYSKFIPRKDFAFEKDVDLASLSLLGYMERTIAERSKILLDTDLKIILLGHQNNFVRTVKIMNNIAKNFE